MVLYLKMTARQFGYMQLMQNLQISFAQYISQNLAIYVVKIPI